MSRTLTVVRLAKIAEILFGEVGLTVNQYRMLTFIASAAPPLAELSRRLAMQPPNVSKLLDGLVERRLVRRVRGADDRRRFELSLTRTGRKLLARADSSCEAAFAYLARSASDPVAPLEAIDRWTPILDEVAVNALREQLGRAPRRSAA
jgi:DNA-binding MarR family transcriptional regulator